MSSWWQRPSAILRLATLVVALATISDAATIPAYATLTASPGCWVFDNVDTLYLAAPTTLTVRFDYAVSYCDNLGGSLIDALDYTPATVWSGFQRPSPTNVTFLSGNPVDSAWSTRVANATYDARFACYDAAGNPNDCATTTKAVVCQRPLLPRVEEWVAWPSGAPAYMSALISYPTTRPVAASVCRVIYADLFYASDVNIFNKVLDAHASSIDKMKDASQNYCLARGGVWTGLANAVYANASAFVSAGATASPVTLGSNTGAAYSLLQINSGTSAAEYVNATSTTTAAFICSKKLTTVTASLTAATVTIGGASGFVRIDLGKAVDLGRQLRVYIYSSDATTALPSRNVHTFVGGGATSVNIPIIPVKVGTATFSVVTDVRDNLFFATPTFGSPTLTVNSAVSITLASLPTALYPAQWQTVTATLTGSITTTIYLQPPTSSCVSFGTVAFASGGPSALSFNVTGLTACGSATYSYVAYAADGSLVQSPSSFSLSVTAPFTFTSSVTSGTNLIVYDGGSNFTAQLAFVPSSNVPVTLSIQPVLANCSDIISISPAPLVFSAGSSTVGKFFLYTTQQLVTTSEYCTLSFVLSDANTFAALAPVTVEIRQQVTLSMDYFPMALDYNLGQPFQISIPRYWEITTQCTVSFTISGALGSMVSIMGASKDFQTGDLVWKGSINVTSSAGTATGTVALNIGSCNVIRPASVQLLNGAPIQLYDTTLNSKRVYQLLPVRQTGFLGSALYYSIFVRNSDIDSGAQPQIQVQTTTGILLNGSSSTLNVPASEFVQCGTYGYCARIAVSTTQTAAYTASVTCFSSSTNYQFSAERFSASFIPSTNVTVTMIPPSTTITEAAPKTVQFRPVVPIEAGANLTIAVTNTQPCVTVTPDNITWRDTDTLSPKYFTVAYNTLGAACDSDTSFYFTQYSASSAYTNNYSPAAWKDTRFAYAAPLISVTGPATISTFASTVAVNYSLPDGYAIPGGQSISFVPHIVESGVQYGVALALPIALNATNTSVVVTFVIKSAALPSATFSCGSITPTYNVRPQAGQLKVQVAAPIFLTATIINGGTATSPLVPITFNISATSRTLPGGAANIVVTRSGSATVTYPANVVLNGTAPWATVTVTPTSAGAVTMIFTNNNSTDFTGNVTSFAMSFVDAVTPWVASTATTVWKGGQTASMRLQFPFVYTSTVVVLTPTHDVPTVQRIQTSPTQATFTPGQLIVTMTLTPQQPVMENITFITTAGAGVATVVTSTPTPFVWARNRMQPAFDGLLSTIYAGAVNTNSFTILVGNPPSGTTTFNVNVANAPQSWLTLSSFTCDATTGNRCRSQSVSLTAAWGANITIQVVPATTLYHVSSVAFPVQVFDQLNFTLTWSDNTLFGYVDQLQLNLTMINAVPASDTLTLTYGFNRSVTYTPTTSNSFALTSASPALQTSIIMTAASVPLTTSPMPVLFTVTGSGTALKKYLFPPSSVIYMRAQKTITVVDVPPLGYLYTGLLNAKTISIVVSALPKPGRVLNVSLVVAVASNLTAVSISPSYLIWTSTTGTLTQTVQVWAPDKAVNCTLQAIENTAYSNALEYRNFRASWNISLIGSQTVAISITRQKNFNVVRPNVPGVLAISTASPSLLPGQQVNVSFFADVPGVLTFPTSVIFINSSAVTQTVSFAMVPGISTLPLNVTIWFNFSGPSSFGPLNIPSTVLLLDASLNITATFPSSKVHTNAPYSAYPLSFTVPTTTNPYSGSGIVVGMSCTQGSSTTTLYQLASPTVPLTSFQFTTGVTAVTLYVRFSSARTDICTFTFTNSPDPTLVSEYQKSSFTVTFVVAVPVLLAITSKQTAVYDGGVLNLTLTTVSNPVAVTQSCNVGQSLNVSLELMTVGINADQPSVSTVIDGTTTQGFAFNVSTTVGLPVRLTNGQASRSVDFDAINTGSTCYGTSRSAVSTFTIVAPDYVRLTGLPTQAFIGNALPFTVSIRPSITVPGPSPTTIRCKWLGLVGALALSGPRVRPVNTSTTDLNFTTWDIDIDSPSPGFTGATAVNLTGFTAAPEDYFTCQGTGAASVAFQNCDPSSNKTLVRDLVSPIVNSTNVAVDKLLRNATAWAASVPFVMFIGESFDITLQYLATPPSSVSVVPVFDARYFTLVSNQTLQVPNNVTFTATFLCIADNKEVPSPIQLRVQQQLNLFRQTPTLNVIVRRPFAINATGLPTTMRVTTGAYMNDFRVGLTLGGAPTRAPVNLTLTPTSGAFAVTPSWLSWGIGDGARRFVNFTGNFAQNNVALIATIDSAEYIVGSDITAALVNVLGLGVVTVVGGSDTLFTTQSVVLYLSLDFPPIQQSLSVDIQYALRDYTSVDYSSQGLLFWPIGSSRTRQVELFADKATSGANPLNYIWNSSEYATVSCVPDVCHSLQIVSPATPSIVNVPSDTQIIFVGYTMGFLLRISSCAGSLIIVTPTLVEAPAAVTFDPPRLTYDCRGQTSVAAQWMNFTGVANADGTDPTLRASAIELEMTETLTGAPPLLQPIDLPVQVEVRAPQAISVQLGTIQYFGRPMLLTITPPRAPSGGTLTFIATASPSANTLILPAGGVTWSPPPAGSSSSYTVPTQNVTFEQTSYAQSTNITLSYSLTGTAAYQFVVKPATSTVITKAPKATTANLTTQATELYKGLTATVQFTIEERPEGTDRMIVTLGSRWVCARPNPTASLAFSVATLSFSATTLTTQFFTFTASVPGCYNIFFTFGSGTPSKFNTTVNCPSLQNITIADSIVPYVIPITDTNQFQHITIPFSVALPQLPVGNQMLYAVPVIVPAAGVPSVLTTSIDPPSFQFSASTVTGSSAVQQFSLTTSNTVTYTVGPFDVWVRFTNASTLHYNTTSLYVGRVVFLPLHYIQTPPVLTYTVYEGQMLSPPIPVNSTGVPPNISYQNSYYKITMAIPTDDSNQPTFRCSPSEILIMRGASTTFGGYFNLVALKASTTPYVLHFNADASSLGSASPTFDLNTNRFNTAINVLVKSLFRPQVTDALKVPITSTSCFIGSLNVITVYFYLNDWIPENSSTVLTVTVTSEHPELVGATADDSQFTFPATVSMPILRPVTLIGYVSTANLTKAPTITFNVQGSVRVASTASLQVSVLDLLGFDVTPPPPSMFAGVGNSRTFTVNPKVIPTGLLTLSSRIGCSGFASINPPQVSWNASKVPRTLTLTGLAVTSSTDCTISLFQTDSSSPTFAVQAMSARVTVIPAPTLSMRFTGDLVQATEIPASYLRLYDLQLLLIVDQTQYVPLQNLTVGVDLASDIVVNSTLNGTAVATSLVPLLLADKMSITRSLNPQQTIVTVTITHSPQYTTTLQETISFVLMPSALLNGTVPDPANSVAQLIITPDQAAPPAQTERQALEASTFSAAAISGLASLASASQVGRVLAIGSMSDCPSSTWISLQDSMPVYLAPIPLRVGSNSDLGVYAGGAIANVALCVVIALAHYGFVKLLATLRGSGYPFAETCATLYFPSMSFFPILILFQVTLTTASQLLLYSPNAAFKVIGAFIFVLVGVLVPGCLYWAYNRASALQYTPPNRVTRRDWLFKRGTYTHPLNETWVPRFNLPFTQLRGEAMWYALFDLGVIELLAFIVAVQPKDQNGCSVRSILAMVIFAAQLLVISLFQPYSAKFDNFFFILGYAIQTGAMSLIVYSNVAGLSSTEAYNNSGRVLLGFAAMLIIKAMIDWGMLFLVCISKWKAADPVGDRDFKSAATIGKFADVEEPETNAHRLLEQPRLLDDEAYVASITCATPRRVRRLRSDGTEVEEVAEVLTGFRRAMDPSVAALSGEHSYVVARASAPSRSRGIDYSML